MSRLTIGILGLGVFGTAVAKTLHAYDTTLIAIDNHAQQINQLEGILTRGIIGDFTDKEVLRAAGIASCDTLVVATGENLESSVLAVLHAKALGVPMVVAKAKSTTTMEVLLKIGADKVLLPERETGISLAKQLLHRATTSLIELDSQAAIVEFPTPEKWVGHSLNQLKLRQSYAINIIGIRHKGEETLTIQIQPDQPLQAGDLLMAVTSNQTIDHFEEYTNHLPKEML